jgi:hypothetical protein
MKKSNYFLIVLTIITAIYYVPIINLPLGPFDEAFILVGAEKILNKQIPHKDFSSEYPLGQISTLAAIFRVFGVTVMAERVYDLIIKSLLSLSIFVIIRFAASNGTALVGWIMSLIWLQHSSAPAYPVYPCILFIFISAQFLLLHMKEQKEHYVLFSAFFIVLAVLFRHDIGIYAAIAITIVLICRRIVGVQSWTPIVSFITSGVLSGLPMLIYFVMNSALEYLYDDLILLPWTFSKYQTFPYPSLSLWNLPFYVFPLVVLINAITAVILIKSNRNDTTAYALLLFSLIGIFFFNQARWRSDMVHLIPLALTAILLSPILLHTLTKKLSLNAWAYRIVFISFIIFWGITLSKPMIVIKRLLSTTNGYIVKNINPGFERIKYWNIREDIRDTVEYIKKNTTKNDYIYVGVKNHDKFNWNEPIIYFLSERDCASRYYVLNTGFQTTAKVQESMVNEFKKRPPRLVALLTRFRQEPNQSIIDSKVNILDNYISSNYELKDTYGYYEIWMEK